MNQIKKSNFCCVVVVLLFFATMVNYFDSFLIGILASVLEIEIGWSQQQYDYIIEAYQFAYAAGTVLMGYLIVRLRIRWDFYHCSNTLEYCKYYISSFVVVKSNTFLSVSPVVN